MYTMEKFFFLLFFGSNLWIVVVGDLPPSVSSVDWQYKQIDATLSNYQQRLIAAIIQVQSQINSTIGIFGTSKTFSDIVSTLTTTSATLGNLATVSSYSNNATSVTCDNIGVKTSSISVDLQRLSKIMGDVATNSSQVIVASANIQGMSAIHYYQINNTVRLALQNCSNSLNQLSSTYTGYAMELANAISQYNQLYVQLITTQKTYCTDCITNFSPSTSQSLAKIDENIDQIEMALAEIEADIRNVSSDIVARVNLINPLIKKSYSLYDLAVNLDSASNLVSGFTQLDTLDILNETANCDDNNWKIAVITYKKSLYYENTIESIINSSNALVSDYIIKAYYSIDQNIMKSDQQTNVTAIIFDLDTLADLYRQYILSLTVATQQLNGVLTDLKNIQGTSCICNGATGESNHFIIPNQMAQNNIFKPLCLNRRHLN